MIVFGYTRPLRVTHPLREVPPYRPVKLLYFSLCGANLFIRFSRTRGIAWHVDESRPSGRQLHTVNSKKKSKLTNLVKISRIEGYNGKYGSNSQGIKKILDDLFEFDQIGQ